MKRIFVMTAFCFLMACNNDSTGSATSADTSTTNMNNATGTGSDMGAGTTNMDTSSMGAGATPGTAGSSSGATNSGSGGTRPGDSTQQ